MKKAIHRIATVSQKSLRLLTRSNPIVLSGATAFFTTFAMSPILIILSRLLDVFFDQHIILPRLFAKVGTVLGHRASVDLQKIVSGFLSLETNIWLTIALTVFFYFVATTLLSSIRQSIHLLWNIRKKLNRKVSYPIKERLIEVAIILLIAALFLFTIPIDEALASVHKVTHFTGFASDTVFYALNGTFSILLTAVWFSCLFRFMPEAKVNWTVALAGGTVTAVLFFAGRQGLTRLLVGGKIDDLFGRSSSIALILLFTFYCSFILYFGASFTYEYAKAIHHPIEPGELGEKYAERTVE